MDRLIAHLAAGAAQIVERRHAGGAADHLHQLDPADQPLLQLAAELLMAAIEAPVKADSDRHVQGEHPLHHLTGARQGEVDWFFAVDRACRPLAAASSSSACDGVELAISTASMASLWIASLTVTARAP